MQSDWIHPLRRLTDERTNVVVVTDVDLFTLYGKFSLDNVKCLDALTDDVEDAIVNNRSPEVLIVKDTDTENNVNWNKFMSLLLKDKEVCVIRWVPESQYFKVKVSEEASHVFPVIMVRPEMLWKQ